MRVLNILLLEGYALALARLQGLGGIRTDEAKYLLNIPYPHPPLVRGILGLTDGWAYQELFWRIVFASLMVQAVWLVRDLARDLTRTQRGGLGALWLVSGGVVLQAGSIMMAPLTALAGLVFCWLLARRDIADRCPGLVALLWLASLLTAHQILLFLPAVLTVFLRMPLPRLHRAVAFGLPLLIYAFAFFSNPLIPASFVIHAGRDLDSVPVDRLFATGRLWLIGGSGVLSVLGLGGMIAGRRWPLLLSLLLVSSFVALSRYDYYAVLFLPLLIAGAVYGVGRLLHPVTAMVAAAISIPLIHMTVPLHGSRARETLAAVPAGSGTLLIAGPFGHEWQYESPLPVRRYRPELLGGATALVCFDECTEFDPSGWQNIDAPVKVWIRQ